LRQKPNSHLLEQRERPREIAVAGAALGGSRECAPDDGSAKQSGFRTVKLERTIEQHAPLRRRLGNLWSKIIC